MRLVVARCWQRGPPPHNLRIFFEVSTADENYATGRGSIRPASRRAGVPPCLFWMNIIPKGLRARIVLWISFARTYSFLLHAIHSRWLIGVSHQNLELL